jgi:hypothetical protein
LAQSYREAKIEIERLVERFARNLDVYKRPEYKETQVRVEFIDPFFEALGWDVRNVHGYAEQYKDVIHEDAIKVGGATRAPDYCFRIGGVRKFFLEAKKPSVSVKGDVGPAYQLRRYAWSAKLPLSILTDFEEFAVYDCRRRPKPTDKVSVGRIMYLTFDHYLDRFDDIYNVFARESVLQGSFDRYVQDTTGKRGTSEVDAEFLKEIEGWRDVLAHNIALRNPDLSVHELNFAVQRTIDRIIFLRMCEDRGIEEYSRLLALTTPTQPSPAGGGGQGGGIYDRLGELYRQADEKYNSDLFDFRADTLSQSLVIDDKVLKPILAGLYYPQSPYEFSVLPAEVLGQVYEQFLGKVIRLTPAHQARVEEKPEVKKAGGVYYTPTYIVDYIVRQTVGKLIEDKTPRQIAKIRILDPACGSGSFLLGAYQYLLDYHLRWYETHDPEKHASGKNPTVYQIPSPASGGGQGGGWRLTTAEKKRILLNNIYGVDIDRQAVEVTKLSLLLKVLEGESEETLGRQLALWRERALPDLGNNIKCGNSLIGPDYFAAQLMPDEDEMRRVNPFDWQAEFPEAMAAGGFDAVIGNPPYVQVLHSERRSELEYFSSHYVSTSAFKKNLFPVFIEQSLGLIRSKGGRLAMIIPDRFFFTPSYIPCRRKILESATLESVLEILAGAFDKAIVGNAVFVASTPKADNYEVNIEHWSDHQVTLINKLSIKTILSDPKLVVNLLMTRQAESILLKCQSVSVPLKSLFSAHVGMMIKDNKSLFTDSQVSQNQKPIVKGRRIDRYSLVSTYFFDPDKAKIFGGTKDPEKHEKSPKILLRKTGDRLIAYLDEIGIYAEQSVYLLLPGLAVDPVFTLAILNSKLLSYLFRNCFITNPIAYPYIQHYDLEQLPIRTINFDDPADVARHDKMVALVERMLELHRKLAAATIPADKTLYQRQIAATDRQIDALVYELYGLTEEEIAVIEKFPSPGGRG